MNQFHPGVVIRWVVLSFGIAGVASIGPAPAGGTPLACPAEDRPIVRGILGAALDTALTRLDVLGYSGAVLVARDDEIILRKAYGWADRAREVRNTTETPFDLTAATTPFTSAAILGLAEERRLALIDSIGAFFPQLHGAIRGVTLGRLLSQTGGAPPTVSGTVTSRDDFVQRIALGAWNVGDTTFRYSAPGYTLLAAVVDKVSGGYRDYVTRRILVPLDMRNTFFRGRHSAASCIARGHVAWRDVGESVTNTSWKTLGVHQLISTVDDLYAWGKSWPRGMFDRAVVINDSAAFGYGGVTRTTPRGTRYLHTFSGGTPGYQTEVAAFPDEGVVWVSISNAADRSGRSIGFDALWYMLGVMFGGAPPVPPVMSILDDAESRAIAGNYHLPSGARFVIRGSGDSLMIGAVGQEAVAALENETPPARARLDSLSLLAL
jgi:CubicO group peptidase (beta-lactamase class C family)